MSKSEKPRDPNHVPTPNDVASRISALSGVDVNKLVAACDDFIHGIDIHGRIAHWPKDTFSIAPNGDVFLASAPNSTVVGKVDNSVLTAEASAVLATDAAGEEASGVPIVSETVVAAAARAAVEDAQRNGQPIPEEAAAIAAAAGAAAVEAETPFQEAERTVEESFTAAAQFTNPNQSTNQESTMSSSNAASSSAKTNKSAAKHPGFWTTVAKVLFWSLLMIALLVAVVYGVQFGAAYIAEMGLGEVGTVVANLVLAAVAIVLEYFIVKNLLGNAFEAVTSYQSGTFDKAVADFAAA